MKSIILICPYFGSLRKDFPFWKLSSMYNRDIDFLIFTDQENIKSEGNIKIEHISFQDFKKRFENHYDFPIRLDSPYKLCDYKPSYGEVLHSYIKGHDFWGHCDLDLVFGDIRSFITDEILDKYDRILSRGHLSIYRNTPEVNSIYRMLKTPSYKYVYSCRRGFAFDEWPGTSRYWKNNYSDRFYDELIFGGPDISSYDLRDVHWRGMGLKRTHICYEYRGGQLLCHYVEDGKICSKPIIYAHFEKRRLMPTISPKDNFLIVPNKIIDTPNVMDVHFLEKHCHHHRIYWPYVRFRAKRIRVRIGNLFRSNKEKM